MWCGRQFGAGISRRRRRHHSAPNASRKSGWRSTLYLFSRKPAASMYRRLSVTMVVVATLLCTAADFSEALRCYSCSSKNNTACLRFDRAQVPLVQCNLQALKDMERYATDVHHSFAKWFQIDQTDIANHLPLNCFKQVIKENTKETILRGCQPAEEERVDICRQVQSINSDILRTVHCSRCSHDACNSSPTLYNNKTNKIHKIILISTTILLAVVMTMVF